MKYLLDTHTAIWAFTDKSKLSKNATSIIDDVCAALCVSIASAWEIAIKVSIGKLDSTAELARFLKRLKKIG